MQVSVSGYDASTCQNDRRHAKGLSPPTCQNKIVSVDMQKRLPPSTCKKMLPSTCQRRLSPLTCKKMFPSTCQTRLSPSTCKKDCSRRHAKQDCRRRHAKKIVSVDMQKKFPVDMPKKIVSVEMPTEWSSICRHAKIRRQHPWSCLRRHAKGFCPSMCQGVLPVRMLNHLL